MKRNGLIRSVLAGSALSLASVTLAQAQATISIGPRVGVQRSQVAYTHDGSDKFYYHVNEVLGPVNEQPSKYGLQVGVGANIQFNHVAIQPALLYSEKGFAYDQGYDYSYNGTSYTVHGTRKLALQYLELPVNLVLSTGAQDGFQLLLGGYAAYALSDRDRQRGYTDEAPTEGFGYFVNNYTSYSRSGAFKGLDFGLNGGVGYRYQQAQIQAIYSLGMTRFSETNKDSYGDGRMRNRSIQLAASYFLPLTR